MLSERRVQLIIASSIRASVVVAAPNYTPERWWECDVWAVTRAGYAVEYEVKLTVADFRNDRDKQKLIYNRDWKQGPLSLGKHASIGSDYGPSRFYYIVPASISNSIEAELPDFAGLGVIPEGRMHIDYRKQAPQLHKKKATKREIRLAQTRMWHRYWHCLHDIERMREKVPT